LDNGRSPSAQQRSYLHDQRNRFGLSHPLRLQRIAIITDSALAVGAITAFGWLLSRHTKVRTKAYRPTQVESAIEWLAETSNFNRPSVDQLIQATLKELVTGTVR
jgi:hypothetical protein